MKQNNQLPAIIIKITIVVWLYAVALIQLTEPANLQIAAVSVILYTIVYAGIRGKLVSGEIARLISLGFFAITFAAFWINVVVGVFWLADVNRGQSPASLFVTSFLYAALYILLYNTIESGKESASQVASTITHSILRMAFTLTAIMSISAITFFVYTLLLQMGINIIPQTDSQINIVVSIIAITAVFATLLATLFEKWLQTAQKQTMEKAIGVIIAITALLTLIISRVKL